MSDVGAIGSILEDMICVLKDMNEKGELSDNSFHACLIMIVSINYQCKKLNIDLGMEKEYFDYIKILLPNIII